MAELFCSQHGPYDASFGTCPYCGGGKRPQQPRPQSDEGAPTDLGAPQPPTIRTAKPDAGYYEDMPTDPGGMGGMGGPAYAPRPSGGYEDEAETEIPRNQGNRRFLDGDSEDVTQIGRRGEDGLDHTELAEAPAGLMGILWVKEGRRRGHIHHIKNGAVVGRGRTSLIFDDPKVSEQHAKFTVEDNQFVLWDFGSLNGTFVNGERIRSATVLKENDVIKMGDTIVVLKVLN